MIATCYRYLLCLLFAVPSTAWCQETPVDFEAEIRPLFIKKCGECHGPQAQKSDLRLDARSFALKGGVSGEVIVPKKSSESELIRRVTSTIEGERMPPESPLSENEIARLTRWIDQGAVWPETKYDRDAALDPRKNHWAFQPIREVTPPEPTKFARNPIDQFVAARLEEQGLKFSPTAERRVLIRRLSLDLLGLPPSPQEIADFVSDDSPAAYERLVDRLLASPHFGARAAQLWLDTVRYADTHGFEVNTPREHAWPYRDYVIGAMNADKPYDQFIQEQIAGDALGTDEATGFLVAAAVLLPGQIGKDEESKRLARQDSLDEIIVGTSGTFLGITLGCARCHDHKFDPFPQQEYYAFQAFFAGVEYGDRVWRGPLETERKRQIAAINSKIAELNSRQPMGDETQFESRLKTLEEEKKRREQPVLAYAGKFREADQTFLLRRGDPEQKVKPVAPAVPRVLGSLEMSEASPEQDRRLKLANWLASPDNPLTARVLVNRLWQSHFGQGIVGTPSDFGVNGVPPTHPDLLDWLAGEFIGSGWSMKHIHRMIVLSRTYRQQSGIPLSARARDDRWLWRFPSRRLEAEAIRDSILSVSGELNTAMGGPGFDFFKSRGGLNGFPPKEAFGPAEFRRMIYAHKIRMESTPVFGAFDCPDAGQPAPKRSRSTTPIQALNLFNSPFVLERAERFAQRLQNTHPESAGDQIRLAYRLSLGREPATEEMESSLRVAETHGLSTLCRVLFNTNEFLFIP